MYIGIQCEGNSRLASVDFYFVGNRELLLMAAIVLLMAVVKEDRSVGAI